MNRLDPEDLKDGTAQKEEGKNPEEGVDRHTMRPLVNNEKVGTDENLMSRLPSPAKSPGPKKRQSMSISNMVKSAEKKKKKT